jgi:hypothetical protein
VVAAPWASNPCRLDRSACDLCRQIVAERTLTSLVLWQLLERVRPQEPHLFLVETSLHPAQHDVVDALLVPQFEKRLAPSADEGE